MKQKDHKRKYKSGKIARINENFNPVRSRVKPRRNIPKRDHKAEVRESENEANRKLRDRYNKRMEMIRPKDEFKVPDIIKENPEIIIKGGVILVSHTLPVARDVYLCYKATKFVYNSWSEIEKETRRGSYNFVKKVCETGLTNYETNIIWNKIEKKIPEYLKEESKAVLKEGISKISEEEISFVENFMKNAI